MLAKESRLGWNLDIIRIDRVVMSGLGVLAGLTWFDWEQVPESLSFTGNALVGIAPFIVLSVGIAAYCQSTGRDNQIARVFHGHPATAIIIIKTDKITALKFFLTKFCAVEKKLTLPAVLIIIFPFN